MKKAIKKYFKTIKTLKNVITMKKRDKNVFTFMGKEGREGRGRREFVLCPRKKKENSARMGLCDRKGSPNIRRSAT